MQTIWPLLNPSQVERRTGLRPAFNSKLEDDPSKPVYFKTVRGEGYRFDPPEGSI